MKNLFDEKMKTLIWITGAVPPTAECVDLIIDAWVKGEGKGTELAEMLEKGCSGAYLKNCFGIEDEAYENAAAVLSRTFIRLEGRSELFEKCEIESSFDEVFISAYLPEGFDCEDAVVIDLDNTSVTFPKRTAEDLHPDVFDQIIMSIEDGGIVSDGDGGYVSDYPFWYSLLSMNQEDVFNIIQQIASICLEDFNVLRKEWGVTVPWLSWELHIPQRTIEDWCSGQRECKMYMRLMIAEVLGILKRRHRAV